MPLPRRARPLDPAVLARAADVIKCLGHPLRLKILEALESGDQTVSELQRRTRATQAMVSQQLASLRGHGVVTATREGPSVRYSIRDTKALHILECIRRCGA